MTLKPLIKWAGGKRQIMHIISKEFPQTFFDYHEPFVGAGSVFMELYNSGKLENKKVYLSDIMMPLINMYNIVKHYPEELMQELSCSKYVNNMDIFHINKTKFNDIKNQDPLSHEHSKELASLFIFLNKTCFNGMYRENSKGLYNIPFGKQKNPTIFNVADINNLSRFLNREAVSIQCCSYSECEDNINPGDFVYLDPPYYGTFTGYNKHKFDEKEQEKLKDFFVRLTDKGCKVALSNSDNEFIRNLYKHIPNVRIIEVGVKRFINSKGHERKNIKKELLIVNYTE